ncbi:hypothetical protein U875_26715 [Pandoraea pnomenusa 3kgm]|nr:hypothetical protein U875_26715 [Pandoraea pnomenusa 3kgm]
MVGATDAFRWIGLATGGVSLFARGRTANPNQADSFDFGLSVCWRISSVRVWPPGVRDLMKPTMLNSSGETQTTNDR